MLSSGCSIEEVSDHLGHEDIQTTRNWYARIIDVKRKQATHKLQEFSQYIANEKKFTDDRAII